MHGIGAHSFGHHTHLSSLETIKRKMDGCVETRRLQVSPFCRWEIHSRPGSRKVTKCVGSSLMTRFLVIDSCLPAPDIHSCSGDVEAIRRGPGINRTMVIRSHLAAEVALADPSTV